MKRKLTTALTVAVAITAAATAGCEQLNQRAHADQPRSSLFIGVDISGSFMHGDYFEDSLDFLATYIYAHLKGSDGLERPKSLFVSSIGGARADEPKTFYPIQMFENKTIEEIRDTLREMFPREHPNPFTDYNAFFEQVAYTVRSKNLVLRPITIVMVSDGIPDVTRNGKTDYGSIVLDPLERLARSVTVRLLYTNATVGRNWQSTIARRRVKVWTQDADVMMSWRDPKIMVPDVSFADQQRFFGWMRDNVDFGVRAHRVD